MKLSSLFSDGPSSSLNPYSEDAVLLPSTPEPGNMQPNCVDISPNLAANMDHADQCLVHTGGSHDVHPAAPSGAPCNQGAHAAPERTSEPASPPTSPGTPSEAATPPASPSSAPISHELLTPESEASADGPPSGGQDGLQPGPLHHMRTRHRAGVVRPVKLFEGMIRYDPSKRASLPPQSQLASLMHWRLPSGALP